MIAWTGLRARAMGFWYGGGGAYRRAGGREALPGASGDSGRNADSILTAEAQRRKRLERPANFPSAAGLEDTAAITELFRSRRDGSGVTFCASGERSLLIENTLAYVTACGGTFSRLEGLTRTQA